MAVSTRKDSISLTRIPSFRENITKGIALAVCFFAVVWHQTNDAYAQLGSATNSASTSASVVKKQIGNPAAYYCTELGHTYEVETASCILPDGVTCQEWDFFNGTCGAEHNYCGLNGYITKVETIEDQGYALNQAICYDGEDSRVGAIVKLLALDEREAEVNILEETTVHSQEEMQSMDMSPIQDDLAIQADTPTSFDWRNKDGQNWMTPVKNQGPYGTCWAFAALGQVESAFDIGYSYATYDKDLSERDTVACTTEKINARNTPDGGSSLDALLYVREHGVTDESCYPYPTVNGDSFVCNNRCADWSSRINTVDNVYYTGTAYGYTIDNVKSVIVNYGPVVSYIRISNGGFDANGVWRCNTDTPVDHGVVLTGYNDEGGYWIAKNSWGTGFGENGYFKVGYGECDISKYVYLSTKVGDPLEPEPCSNLADNTFCATYYEGNAFFYGETPSHEPTYKTEETTVQHLWQNDGPGNGVPHDNFSVRWEGKHEFEDGMYVFEAISDDGVKLWVDEELVLYGWYNQPATKYRKVIPVSAGLHDIRVDYYEAQGEAIIDVDWEKVEISQEKDIFNVAYYNNPYLYSDPVHTTQETKISHDWLDQSPDAAVNNDYFSARWEGNITFEEGMYTFTATGDDGMRLLIDNELVINGWNIQARKAYQKQHHLTAGTHQVVFEYFEWAGFANVDLTWSREYESPSPNTFQATYFNHTDIDYSNPSTSPVLIRQEKEISHNWSHWSPHQNVNTDQFSVQWEGTFEFTEENYIMNTLTDDGMRVWIADQLIVDRWWIQGAQWASTPFTVTKGIHTVRVMYFEHYGQAVANVSWEPLGGQ